MLIEVVTLSLAVLTSLPVLTASPISEDKSVALSSTLPEKKLIAMLSTENDQDAFSDNTIPQHEIVAMLEASDSEPEEVLSTPPPTATPTPEATTTPTPPPPTETPTPTPTNTPTPTPQAAPPTQPSSGDLESLFTRFSEEYKVDKDLLKKIAACESGFNASSHNVAHDYGGMYQFASSTWTTVRGRMGADTNTSLRFSAEEAIKTAAYHIANGGRGAWPNCQ